MLFHRFLWFRKQGNPEIGGLGGHDITVNVIPIQVSGDTSRVSIFLTAVLACKNSDADPMIVDQPVSDQDSISFYTYPSTYVMDFGCDLKKPVEGNVVWSETSTPALNGSFVIGGAVSARYEIGYEDLNSYQTQLIALQWRARSFIILFQVSFQLRVKRPRHMC